MRTHTACLAVGVLGLLGILATTGCEVIFALDQYTFETGGTGGTTGTGGAGGTTIDPGCIASETPNPVRDDCGLFVSSSKGSDTNDGTKATPYATIAKALASPEGGPIYLCAETFPEGVHLKSGRTIYGGLDCTTDWTWTGAKKSEISPAAGQVPLVVDPQISVVTEDLVLRAQDATEPGGSSVALIATAGASVSLARCDLEAGEGKDGAAGVAFAMNASAGTMGNAGGDACSADSVGGGGFVQNLCDDQDPNDDSIGGKGGSGDLIAGGNATPGTPLGAMNGGDGQLDAGGTCTLGGTGDDGADGSSGAGAAGIGTIAADGYTGIGGNVGVKGKPGQGGGGGGGAKGGSGVDLCTLSSSAGGASGGSGGAGGCGGAGGKGGQAGGASIGVVSIGAKLNFDTVKISTKAGGSGGKGGDGQLGGKGGDGGKGGVKGAATKLKDGCAGGAGGTGGAGGKGGGGIGGHSIGIAYIGEAPDTKGATITIGTPGEGGAGDGATGNGAKGVAAQTQVF